jgi:hypothetical protein
MTLETGIDVKKRGPGFRAAIRSILRASAALTSKAHQMQMPSGEREVFALYRPDGSPIISIKVPA